MDEEEQGESKNLSGNTQQQAAEAMTNAVTGRWPKAVIEALKSPTAKKIIAGVSIAIIIGCVLGMMVILSTCLPCLNGDCGKTETNAIKPVENNSDITKLLGLSDKSKRQQFILENASNLAKELQNMRGGLDQDTQKEIDPLIVKLQELITFNGAKVQTQAKVNEIDQLWLQVKNDLYKNTHGFVDFNDTGVSLNAFGNNTSHPTTGLNYEVWRYNAETAEKIAQMAISLINQGSFTNPGTLNGYIRKDAPGECSYLVSYTESKLGLSSSSAQKTVNTEIKRGDIIHFTPKSPYGSNNGHWAIAI